MYVCTMKEKFAVAAATFFPIMIMLLICRGTNDVEAHDDDDHDNDVDVDTVCTFVLSFTYNSVLNQ